MVESKKTSKPHTTKAKHESPKTHHAAKSSTQKAHTKSHATNKPSHHKETQQEKEYNPQILFTLIGIGVVIIAAVLLVVMNTDFLNSNDTNENNVLPNNNNQSNQASNNEPVVSVNGEDITAQEVTQIQQQLSSQGQQQISQEQAIQQLITNTILLQQTQSDIESITNEEAEAELEELLSEQGFTTQDLKSDLEQQGISYEQTLEDFKQRIAIDRFLEENIDTSSVEISDEEVQQTYTMYEQQMGNQTPPFEQVQEQIRNQLEQEQIQQLQSQFIEQLIEEAEVEYY